MIANEALSAWLNDFAAQERAQDKIDAFTRKWSHHPSFGFVAHDIARLPNRSAEAVLGVARRFLDRTDDLDALIQEMIAEAAADPFFRPPFHALSSEIHTSLLLFHHSDLSVALGVTGVDMLAAKKSGPRGATSIGFTGHLNLFRYIKAGRAVLSFWEAPRITDSFVAAEAGQCRCVGRRRIEDGEEIIIDGRHQSFIVEHAESDMVYFHAMVRAEASPITAEYDSRAHSFVVASSTDEASSRLQMMATLLRSMERDDGAQPLLESLAASPDFYVRWHLMRELLALDAEAALPALRKMAVREPHPEVRAAAAQTLTLFFAEDAAEETQPEAVACRA